MALIYKIANDIDNKVYIGQKKISKSLEGKFGIESRRFKKLLCFDLNNNFIREYSYMSQASKELNLSLGNISEVCNGKRKSSGGYIWRYKND